MNRKFGTYKSELGWGGTQSARIDATAMKMQTATYCNIRICDISSSDTHSIFQQTLSVAAKKEWKLILHTLYSLARFTYPFAHPRPCVFVANWRIAVVTGGKSTGYDIKVLKTPKITKKGKMNFCVI